MEELLNTSFIAGTKLQFAWDSTSLGLLKECPYKYYLTIILGWQSRQFNVHLSFGLLYHAALERYDHAKCDGKTHHEAQVLAVRYCLEQTWEHDLGRPMIWDDKNKNRITLVRTVVWYLEQFAEDPLETVVLANGKPAVELSFRMELEYELLGTRALLCGHLDRLVLFNDDPYTLDRKTTKGTIDQEYFAKFTPDNQFSTYDLAGTTVYKLPIKGLIVDAAQVAITFSRFQRGMVTRTPDQREEWHRDLGFWLKQAELYAEAEIWPQNDKSCGNYGGCAFRPICALPPRTREQWLRTSYAKRTWDPLQVRGDI